MREGNVQPALWVCFCEAFGGFDFNAVLQVVSVVSLCHERVFHVIQAAGSEVDRRQYPTTCPSLRTSVPPCSMPVSGWIMIAW